MTVQRRASPPVIAIGASAGGLEALLELLPLLTRNGSNRYIVAQHMSKTGHADLVVRVLGRKSALPVVEATNDMAVEPDTVYLLPAGFDGVLDNGRIHLRAPDVRHFSAPSVDVLFASIARSAGTAAIGVVLSGAGSDGVIGARAIRTHGGQVLVQRTGSTAIHGMVGAVVRAGLASHELSPAEIAEHINALTPQPQPAGPMSVPRHPYTGSPKLELLLQRMSDESGVDFTMYRQGTLLRRMERRSDAVKCADLDDYMAYALDHPDERAILQGLFLISWSWFFRDRAAFDRLRDEIHAALQRLPQSQPYVIWVPGCASGEECYSLAMLVRDIEPDRPLLVIGSDLSGDAIALARAARYKAAALRELPDGFLERYFRRDGDEYRVIDSLRESCTFREEDVLANTPVQSLDLVSCRNLLIYMNVELHEQLLGRIHSALRADGLLFLGLSEGLSRSDLARFTTVDAVHRIYRRRTAA